MTYRSIKSAVELRPVIAGTCDRELAGDVLSQPRDCLGEAVIEFARADPVNEIGRKLTRIVVTISPTQLGEERRVRTVGLIAGAQLAGDDGTQVRQDQDLKAALARHPLAHLAGQGRGHRV